MNALGLQLAQSFQTMVILPSTPPAIFIHDQHNKTGVLSPALVAITSLHR